MISFYRSSKNSSVVAKRKSSTRNKPAIVSANTEQKFETLLADPKVNQSFRIFLEKVRLIIHYNISLFGNNIANFYPVTGIRVGKSFVL
jgi:hypothetical protein